MDVLRDLWGPGLIFLVLCFWLVRKVVRAARIESELEGERLSGTLADELQRGRAHARASQRPQLVAVPPPEARPAEDYPPEAPQPRAAPPLSAPPPWLAPPASAPPLPPLFPAALAGADAAAALAEHLPVVAALVEERETALLALTPQAVRRRVEVLWVRSASGHVAWCERRHPALAEVTLVREVICVARIQDGKAVERWSFG